MKEKKTYKLSYDQMSDIIKNYYHDFGIDVTVKIKSEIADEQYKGNVMTTICVLRKYPNTGKKEKILKYLTIEDLKEIIGYFLNLEIDESINISINAHPITEMKDNKEVKRIVNQTFTVDTIEKKKARKENRI